MFAFLLACVVVCLFVCLCVFPFTLSSQSLFADMVTLLATVGLHFHTPLRLLGSCGRPFWVPWRYLGCFVASFGTPGAPRAKSLKKYQKRAEQLTKKDVILRAFLALFHKNRGCVWVFVLHPVLFPLRGGGKGLRGR